jgi:uncharacterized RDD family membrane protein YckC
MTDPAQPYGPAARRSPDPASEWKGSSPRPAGAAVPVASLVPVSSAGWFRRAWAFLFDALMLAGGLVVLVVLPSVLVDDVFHASGWLPDDVLRVMFALSIVFVVGYPVYFIGKRGQTPGMKLQQIRLYRLGPAGELYPPTFKTSWGRWAVVLLLQLVSGVLFGIPIILDYLWSAWDKQRQCLHDKAAGTVAVDERV